MEYARPLARLIGELEKLPGVGPKSAQRLAYYILRIQDDEAQNLAESIISVKQQIHFCRQCFNFTDQELCTICRDPRRDPSILCIVAEPRDLMAMDKTNEFKGLYHVLHGVISPMEGIGPEMLKVRELLVRVRDGAIKEAILATNPTIEGEATALYLSNLLKPIGVRVTRIAHGLPMGGDMDYADQATLIQALEWRREM
jgi:recombination protein RecR